MKLAWKCGMLLLCSFSPSVIADSNTPTDDVIKQQFAKQSGGMMIVQRRHAVISTCPDT